MKTRQILAAVAACALGAGITLAEDANPIKDAMKLGHKAPKGEKKMNEKIVEGTITAEELQKLLTAYKAVGDTKPAKGDAAAFKTRWSKLIAATEDVVAKKDGATAAYKDAVNCKACHSEHKPD